MIAAADFAALMRRLIEMLRRLGDERLTHLRIARGDAAGNEDARISATGVSVSSLAIDERLSRTSLAKSAIWFFSASSDIIGISFSLEGKARNETAELLAPPYRCRILRKAYAAFSVSPPTSRLQGQSSSVCNASSTRSVSFGARPTLRFVA